MNPQINKDNPKNLISIITPFFNAEKFIQEAIESVFAQTYSNWELLLIDDGSTDGSSKIARQYAERYPEKVRYLEHEEHKNRGASASRNVGINKSNGEYIAFLDADDVWLPKKLEEQIQIMNAYPEVAMVYGPALHWFSWSDEPENGKSDFLQELGVKTDAAIKPPDLLKEFLKDVNVTPYPSGMLVRHKIIRSEGGFEDEFRLLDDDQVLYVKICLVSPVFVASQCWFKYRQHADSVCHMIEKNGVYSFLRQHFFKWVTQYLEEKRITDTEIRTILKKKMNR
jgi:glycosyltransferase involved in cell wall biosynthesis